MNSQEGQVEHAIHIESGSSMEIRKNYIQQAKRHHMSRLETVHKLYNLNIKSNVQIEYTSRWQPTNKL